MRSLSPKDFESLPPLEAPAGYICVIRDIDNDTYRIDSADHPATFIQAIVDEDERAFGIELVSLYSKPRTCAKASPTYLSAITLA